MEKKIVRTETTPSGAKIHKEGTIADGKKEGKWVTVVHPKENTGWGKEYIHTNYYKGGKLHGICTIHCDGELTHTGRWVEGKRHGIHKFYCANLGVYSENLYVSGHFVESHEYGKEDKIVQVCFGEVLHPGSENIMMFFGVITANIYEDSPIKGWLDKFRKDYPGAGEKITIME